MRTEESDTQHPPNGSRTLKECRSISLSLLVSTHWAPEVIVSTGSIHIVLKKKGQIKDCIILYETTIIDNKLNND